MTEHLKPSSVTIQDQLEQRIRDQREYIKELEGVIIFWRKTMEFYAEKPWYTLARFREIRRHLDLLGLGGNGELRKHGQTEPLSKMDTTDDRTQP